MVAVMIKRLSDRHISGTGTDVAVPILYGESHLGNSNGVGIARTLFLVLEFTTFVVGGSVINPDIALGTFGPVSSLLPFLAKHFGGV